MTNNESLYLSIEIRKQMGLDLSGVFQTLFPYHLSIGHKSKKSRDRVFNSESTMITMINTMVHEDKSLQNSVNIYSKIHEDNKQRIIGIEEEFKTHEIPKRKGRRRLTSVVIQESKIKSISFHTSAYSQARQRLSIEYVRDVYNESAKLSENHKHNEFHGRRVLLTDGTYLQMQDSHSIREKFNNSTKDGYPRGLLSAIIDQGSGLVIDFVLDSDKKSELELLSRMIKNIPSGTLLLADDLYNCFAILAKLISKKVDIIVPGKRKRNYKVIKKISAGDEIVELKGDKSTSKMMKELCIEEETILMRRIEINNPNNTEKTLVLYTTILDENIEKTEIYLKYLSRWDIEISIREIKAIMEINVLRSKTPEMASKELMAGLIAYNYIRSLIARTVDKTDFSPESDIIQEYYKTDTSGYVDKLGRVYSRSSPGRYGYTNDKDFRLQSLQAPI